MSGDGELAAVITWLPRQSYRVDLRKTELIEPQLVIISVRSGVVLQQPIDILPGALTWWQRPLSLVLKQPVQPAMWSGVYIVRWVAGGTELICSSWQGDQHMRVSVMGAETTGFAWLHATLRRTRSWLR